jgi:hypothetical protein
MAPADAGLCASCIHVKKVTSDRGSVFYMCLMSFERADFPKYPRLPVLSCICYQARNL